MAIGPVPDSSSFNLDLDEVIQAATERLLLPPEIGHDIAKCRRAVQLCFARLATTGLNLWTVELATLPLVALQPDYLLDLDTLDVLEMVVRNTALSTATDIPVNRMARDDYHYLPNKLSAGEPRQIWVERTRDRPVLHVYPVPRLDSYELRYYRVRRFKDLGSPLDAIDIPPHWMGVVIAGVAYYLSLTHADVTEGTRAALKVDWNDEFATISPEDRDRGPMNVSIDLSAYMRP
jgi:hypothetical protein